MSKYAPESIEYMKQMAALYQMHDSGDAPAPEPPSFGVAMDVSACLANVIAMIFDVHKTGDTSITSPSLSARLAAAELIDATRTSGHVSREEIADALERYNTDSGGPSYG